MGRYRIEIEFDAPDDEQARVVADHLVRRRPQQLKLREIGVRLTAEAVRPWVQSRAIIHRAPPQRPIPRARA